MVEGEKTLNSVVSSFMETYAQRDKELDFSVWLENRIRQEIPELPEGSEQKLVQDIISAVSDYDKTLSELNEAMDAGTSKEEWFVEQMEKSCAGMEHSDAGQRLRQMDQELTRSDVQLMQEMDGMLQYEPKEVNDAQIEWNQYSVKHKIHEIGQKACLAGLAVSANAIRSYEESGGELAIEDAVRAAFRGDMVAAPHEVKAVVAGAVKVVAERKMEDTFPFDTPIEDISDMAGVAVEGTEALFNAASGQISSMEAMDKIGRAGVVSACRIGRRVLQGRLVKIPIAGQMLVEIFGGLLEHMESPVFYENVYTVVHDAAVATWEGIKDFGKRTVQKIKNIATVLFG